MMQATDGGRMRCTIISKDFQWKMQGMNLMVDIYIVEIHGHDMVLGIQADNIGKHLIQLSGAMNVIQMAMVRGDFAGR
jgi:hypothetical protein